MWPKTLIFNANFWPRKVWSEAHTVLVACVCVDDDEASGRSVLFVLFVVPVWFLFQHVPFGVCVGVANFFGGLKLWRVGEHTPWD